MKETWMKNSVKLFSVIALSALALAGRAAEPTALELIKEGNRYVGEDTKDKVVQIRSEKSVGGLTPVTWWIVYYDVDARMKATEVRFDGGKKTDVQRPFRIFERAGAYKNVLEQSKLKIDSDEALKIAQKDGLLDRVKLTNAKMFLEKWEDMPVWKITFWAERVRETNKTVDIGQLFVHATDGKVVHRDLHINRVD